MTDALTPEDTRDALRKIGVLLFGIGALMLYIRKADGWGDFVLFLVLALPAAAFYGAGVLTTRDTGGLQPWQTVASVFGLILAPLALFQFVNLIGVTPGPLTTFWIFGVTAALAFYAGFVAGIRFHLLAGAIALIISWSGLWDKIFGDEGIGGHIGVYRGLLGLAAVGLIAAGIVAWRSDPDKDEGARKFSELFTGAGIAAVIACGLGIIGVVSQALSFFVPAGVDGGVGTSMIWDILLLAVSIGLIAVGAQIGTRGPVYVGAIGLILFLLIAGLDLNDESPEPGKLGLWPLILLIGGGGAILASLSAGVSLGDRPRDLVKKISNG